MPRHKRTASPPHPHVVPPPSLLEGEAAAAMPLVARRRYPKELAVIARHEFSATIPTYITVSCFIPRINARLCDSDTVELRSPFDIEIYGLTIPRGAKGLICQHQNCLPDQSFLFVHFPMMNSTVGPGLTGVPIPFLHKVFCYAPEIQCVCNGETVYRRFAFDKAPSVQLIPMVAEYEEVVPEGKFLARLGELHHNGWKPFLDSMRTLTSSRILRKVLLNVDRYRAALGVATARDRELEPSFVSFKEPLIVYPRMSEKVLRLSRS